MTVLSRPLAALVDLLYAERWFGRCGASGVIGRGLREGLPASVSSRESAWMASLQGSNVLQEAERISGLVELDMGKKWV